MKHTNVSGLKARLSDYLAAARGGETVLVHDRRTPIVRLVPANDRTDDLEVTEASRPLDRAKTRKPVPLKRKVDVVKLLRDSRDQR